MREMAAGSSIKYIIELDKKARERVAEARRQAEEIEFEAESKKKQMVSDYNEKAKESLKAMEESYREEADRKTAWIEAEKRAKIESFDKALSSNREKLLNEVFKAVTGKKRRNRNG